jgi:hypothetical protein
MPRALPLCAAFACALAALGCGANPCDLEPAYGGDATDEVWHVLDDAKDDAKEGDDAADIERPTAGQAFQASDGPPTFSWTSALKLALAPAHPPQLRRARSGVDALVDSLANALVPRAFAHEPPITCDAYLVDVTVPGQQCPVQAVTTELEATLDDAAWEIVGAAKGQDGFSIVVTSAYLESNRITEGPFKSAQVKFAVK